ncbi:carboxymuconolactone decarboxylase family protein [Amycolatopsis acidicola]|uniref:Carboxymuconolactone decarboxylase family protein n=1 Tax=Amycolatopsis acidicola TaxID=2596893 RepID=A0A5N0V850_9PSEU|nr:carboxymuconolactone decarboxylase family protein [Amycolatopsis acidicola]KAA9160692.1 carboxymuconolactone decarboxylase family protein [Amycolatopsis acidicola]
MTPGPQRLPLPPEEAWSDEQHQAAQRIVSGPRGELYGPFVPLMHSPEFMTRLQLVGEHLRFGKALDDDLFELTILIVARHWDQGFEWGFHRPLANRAGVPEAVVEDVAQCRRPSGGRPGLAEVWDAVHTLLHRGSLTDELYDRLSGLGPKAIVELVGTVGYYTTLALMMNVARTPPPDGAPALPPLGGRAAVRGGEPGSAR